MNTVRKALTLLLFLVATTALANDVASHTLILPSVGRTPGAFGSLWRTDVYITNAARQGNPATVTVVYSRENVPDQVMRVSLAPRGTAILRDIVRDTFAHDQAIGLLRIHTESAEAKISARARIVNSGSSAGEFGQAVPALPLHQLSRVALLPSLSGVNGQRTNLGIANPHSFPVPVFISFFDRDGELRGGYSTTIAPRTSAQVNDVFGGTAWGEEGASIQVSSERGVYAFASIIRRDSGDADFVAPVTVERDTTADIVQPACANPAPLRTALQPADGYIVTFKQGVNAALEGPRLVQVYGFSIRAQYSFGFHGLMSPAVLAAIRCEPSVLAVDQNGVVVPTGE